MLELTLGACSEVSENVFCSLSAYILQLDRRFDKLPGMEQISFLFFILPSVAVHNVVCGCNCCRLSRAMVTDFAILSDLEEKPATKAEAHGRAGIPLACIYAYVGSKLLPLIFVHYISLIQ